MRKEGFPAAGGKKIIINQMQHGRSRDDLTGPWFITVQPIGDFTPHAVSYDTVQHVQPLVFSGVNEAIFRRAHPVCPDKLQLRKPRLALRQHYKAIPVNVDGGGDQIQERVKILSVHACNFVKRLDVLVILRCNFRILAQGFEQKRFPDRVFSLHVHGALYNAVVLVQQT